MVRGKISREKASKILDINIDASPKEIEKAFDKKVLETHPDKNSNDESSDELKNGSILQDVIEARNILLSEITEIDTLSSSIQQGFEDMRNIDLKKTQLLEKKNRELKKVTSKIFKRNIPRIGILAMMAVVLNSLKDIQPLLERFSSYSSSFEEMIILINVMMIIMIIATLLFTIMSAFRFREKEIEKIETQYTEDYEKLIKSYS